MLRNPVPVALPRGLVYCVCSERKISVHKSPASSACFGPLGRFTENTVLYSSYWLYVIHATYWRILVGEARASDRLVAKVAVNLHGQSIDGVSTRRDPVWLTDTVRYADEEVVARQVGSGMSRAKGRLIRIGKIPSRCIGSKLTDRWDTSNQMWEDIAVRSP